MSAARHSPALTGKLPLIASLSDTSTLYALPCYVSAAGTAYRLLVWVGDEVKPEMRPVVVKASEFEGTGEDGGLGSLVLWVIAGLLGIGIVLLAILVLRRKPS